MVEAETDPTNGQGPRRRRKAKAENWIHFRVSPDLRKALDSVVVRLSEQGVPTSRSAVARSILHDHLGMDPVQSEVEESMKVVWAITQKAMGRITADAGRKMPDYLKEGMNEYFEQRVAGAPRADD